MTLFLQLILFPIYGAAVHRFKGMAHPLKKYTPHPLPELIFVLPYALICIPPNTDSWWTPVIVLVVTLAAVVTGHGGWMDLGTWTKKRKSERLEPLIRWLRNDLPRYWYDVVGLTVKGLCITAPAAIALHSLPVAIGGIAFPLAYMGARYVHYDDGEKATELAEYLAGWGLYMALAVCVVLGYI